MSDLGPAIRIIEDDLRAEFEYRPTYGVPIPELADRRQCVREIRSMIAAIRLLRTAQSEGTPPRQAAEMEEE